MRRSLKFAAGLGIAAALSVAAIGTSGAQTAGASGLGFGWGAIAFGFTAPYFDPPKDHFSGSGEAPPHRGSAPGYASDPADAYTGDPAYYGNSERPTWRERQIRGLDY